MDKRLEQDCQWDPETESPAQERAWQQQLQMPQYKYMLADSLRRGEAEDDESEDLQIYDSLDVAAHPHAKRHPSPLQPEYLDVREGTSQLLSDDAYSDLRYDPNWRANLLGAGRFDESPQISIEEYRRAPKGKPGLEPVIRGGYRHVVTTSPAAAATPQAAGSESDQPYRLHPRDGRTGSVTSSQASQLGPPEADISRPSSERDDASQRGLAEQRDGEGASRYPEVTEDTQGLNTCTQQDPGRTQGGPTPTQPRTSPKALLGKKPKDIVELNKISLGRNASKRGSYATAHALKQEMPHNANKVHKTLKEMASTESQGDSSDPKLRIVWYGSLFVSSSSKEPPSCCPVIQISKGKKAQRKEYPNPPRQQQQPPAPGVRAERGDCLSSPLARPAAETRPKPRKTTSSQPLPPTIHLNISLNTSSHLLPLPQQKSQDAVVSLASLHGCPRWSPTPAVELALSPGYRQTNPGKSSQMYREGVSATVLQLHRNLESSLEQWQRTTALKWPLLREGEAQKWSPNEVHTEQFPQDPPTTPTRTLSLGSGSPTALPPIGKPTAGKEPDPGPAQSGNTAYPIHRSGSDGYLVQMERQKQLRVTYKAYSLKDYKQLKSDIELRGLGPDYTATEKTKMKRQRLYSNVIREQNKTISRIPFLPAKDPEGDDKKVPRTKALEYAKTIAKPPAPSQPKRGQKHWSGGLTERAPYLEGLDVSRLEALRKRHEEEKQAVALFRKGQAV
ncbi:jhy protein homolog [Enoplosus armatus]|uniref:jhy protein homolog n=1 Tax=Enoplosus armatus TaxID=215367 RepID=UPI0039944175